MAWVSRQEESPASLDRIGCAQTRRMPLVSVALLSRQALHAAHQQAGVAVAAHVRSMRRCCPFCCCCPNLQQRRCRARQQQPAQERARQSQPSASSHSSLRLCCWAVICAGARRRLFARHVFLLVTAGCCWQRRNCEMEKNGMEKEARRKKSGGWVGGWVWCGG
jgi:hypothetical protein